MGSRKRKSLPRMNADQLWLKGAAESRAFSYTDCAIRNHLHPSSRRHRLGNFLAMGTDIRIGTSGYHYKHWVGTFYPPKTPPARMLEFYARHFDTLELNSSFYRLPTVTAFEAWRDATPQNFSFAV